MKEEKDQATQNEIFVEANVIQKYIEEFIQHTRENQNSSRSEKGNIKFDLYQSVNDKSKFILHEAFESIEAAENHKTTPHYYKWKESVKGFMATPRQKHNSSSIIDDEKYPYRLI